MKRSTYLAAAMGLSTGLLAASPALAQDRAAQPRARTVVVDTTADTTDAAPGDGRCRDRAGRCSLRAAVQEANATAGDNTIRLSRTTYRLTVAGAGEDAAAKGDLDITSRVVIDGRGATLELRGLGDRGFDVAAGSSLRVADLRVQNGRTADTESGGAFRSAGTLHLVGVVATGNVVSGTGASGGAVVNLGGTLVVKGSVLAGNSAARAGGAIEANAGTTTIDGSLLSGNTTGTTPGNGGAFHLTGAGRVGVTRSAVVANSASAEGGGLWNSATGTMTVDRSTVRDNVANGLDADQGGGGIFSDGGTTVVTGSTVAGNSAPLGSGSGGGIFNNAGRLDVTSSTITTNAAARAGGGIETLAGTVSLDRVMLVSNTTGAMPGNGGGLHTSGAGTVEVDRSVVVANTAANEGGGLWNSAAGTLTVDRSYLLDNAANGDLADEGGGGIFNQGKEDGTGGGTVTVDSTWIVGNQAMTGAGSGGGVLNERGTVTLTGSIIAGNRSARAGGGIEAVGGTTAASVGTTTLDGVLLFANATGPMPGNGGGLHLTGTGRVTVSGSRVFANSASNEGGGLWNSPTGTMVVTTTKVHDNTVGMAANGPNVFQKGPVAGGALTVDGTPVAEGPNALTYP